MQNGEFHFSVPLAVHTLVIAYITPNMPQMQETNNIIRVLQNSAEHDDFKVSSKPAP